MDKETFFEQIKGKRIALCGVGRSHMPLADLFTRKGALVSVRDKREFEQLGSNGETLKKLGVKLILGKDYLADLDEDIIFRTPGMKFSLSELQEARENGQVVTSELEVFFDLCPCKIYAVTGSDGKTTTTSVMAEFLRSEGKTVHLGGNIGKPLLPEIEIIEKDHVAVVELSSFQLISMRKSPDVAVITNLSPNHLDWHKDMEEYIEAKKNVFIHQNAFSRTVINADNELTAALAKDVRGQCLMFSREKAVEHGAFCQGGFIFTSGIPKTTNQRVMEVSDIFLPGVHNIENYMAAICAVWGDVSTENIIKVAKNFTGVEHRIEFVREVDGVKYYNDSIATSPSRTISGTLSLYDKKIILLSGGYDKNIPYDSLGPVICEKVKTLILMGATAQKIEDSVKAAPNYDENGLEIVRVQNMAEALLIASNRAEKGDIVSLSPASAGFDLYTDFEARGRHFKQLVNEMK
ncbi:UDP-N-acetylmuramoyl-L-alanine--D-glutamate ligase [Scatolibacter rhodanostii]|uniref:UDP-N-acetylmuramoyl-L-alanine--D-glutamate ligase n=1 Tax=Scatolibacter rhodanostii TaxID=2014781 RepID=UPI000C071E7E|nr:UDP-N-acetylmuramoyl-L-alanine--D-glutamate ligase [Scatolibacter rhodanostii]